MSKNLEKKNECTNIQAWEKQIILCKKKTVAFLFFVVFFIFVLGFFFMSDVSSITAATYNWLQESWGGGESNDTPNHNDNQQNWTKYESASGMTVGDDLKLIRNEN